MAKTTEYERAQKEALAQLRKLGGEMFAEEDIGRGDRFTIPQTMSLRDAAKFLDKKAKEDEEISTFQKLFPFTPRDGAVATVRAIKKAFGTLRHVETQGFWGPNPPQMIEVEVAFGVKEQVPWGAVQIPALEDVTLTLHSVPDEELGLVFGIVVEGKKKQRYAVEGLFRLIEEELKTNSIYRGHAVDGNFTFLDLSAVDPDKVVYPSDTLAQLEASVLAPIRYPDALRKAGVQLKQAVLLHGGFGVGKTLFAYLAAQECEAHGITFIQVRPNKDDLERAMQAARMYAPAVVFFEDVDTIASAEEAQDHISGLLELFDGVRSKGVEVMAILTTNHPDRIHKGMMRPGRLDAVIEIPSPDAAGIIKLCQTLVPSELLAEDIAEEVWDQIAEAAEGYIPAFVHEGCKRAIKYALNRNAGVLDGLSIDGEDLRLSMVGLRPQYEKMQGARDLHEADTLAAALGRVVTERVEAGLRENLDERLLADGS